MAAFNPPVPTRYSGQRALVFATRAGALRVVRAIHLVLGYPKSPPITMPLCHDVDPADCVTRIHRRLVAFTGATKYAFVLTDAEAAFVHGKTATVAGQQVTIDTSATQQLDDTWEDPAVTDEDPV